jgi:hypothetical protein
MSSSRDVDYSLFGRERLVDEGGNPSPIRGRGMTIPRIQHEGGRDRQQTAYSQKFELTSPPCSYQNSRERRDSSCRRGLRAD